MLVVYFRSYDMWIVLAPFFTLTPNTHVNLVNPVNPQPTTLTPTLCVCSLLSNVYFRFHRWDTVEQPRVIRPSKTPQIARDTLDEKSSSSPEQQQQQPYPRDSSESTTVPPPSPARDGDNARTTEPPPPPPTQQQLLNGEAKAEESGTGRASPATGARSSAEGRGSDDAIPSAAAASVPVAPFDGAGGGRGQIETPSFTAAKTAASAAAFLRQGLHEFDVGPGPVELPAADDENGNEDDNEEGERVASLQFGARELSRRRRLQEQRAEGGGGGGEGEGDGGGDGAVRLRRPPSLEAVDGEGAGLGLGLRLGVEAMSSPPPRSSSAGGGAAGDKGKAGPPPPLWSPRSVVGQWNEACFGIDSSSTFSCIRVKSIIIIDSILQRCDRSSAAVHI